jgi:hypothetical protein
MAGGLQSGMGSRKLRVVRACGEDYDRMRLLEDGARWCDSCGKRVHDIRDDRDARILIRDAYARDEQWACIRVAVAATALAACASTETPTFRATFPAAPVVQSSSSSGGGICDIDPSACPQPVAIGMAPKHEYKMEVGWGELPPPSTLDRIIGGLSRAFSRFPRLHRLRAFR